ncbi:hypothetical protein IWW36_001763 [Coemansia brasiliensis]|uniref:Uncharacterized protein n=1 Tax=Coemansia brasiliensis TaxID=2650707 RepID=A0A9W8I944_9FUNG|nr:hypothetical protein IWW36_001763 [Coemansia brasiliensis]
MVDLVMQESTDKEGHSDPLYQNSRVTVSVDMKAISNSLDYSSSRIYEGTAQLFDPGLYALDAQIELRNGRWNAELQQYSPEYENTEMQTTLPNNKYVHGKVHVLFDPRHPTYLKRHQNLPLCTDGDIAGRWIPEQNLPRAWKPWQYMRPIEDGRVWLPYHCRLRRISHAEFVFHMSRQRPSIHWYGDSNSRRTLRPFIMGGKWCHEANTTTRLDCLCNDAPRDLFPDEWYDSMPVPHWYRVHTAGVDGNEIYTDLRLQQRQPTDPRPILDKYPSDFSFGPDYIPPGYRLRDDYFDLYYHFTRGTLDMYGSYWKRDITLDSVAQYPVANLVVFQMVTWDASFGTYKNFVHQVPQLVNRLRAIYPHAEFIYRSGPYWCCRNAEDQTKKYSRLRFQAFDTLAKKYFQQKLKARVWDVANLARQRPPESKRLPENMPCRSAHSRSEQIYLDNQIFMNMLVNN